MGLFNRGIMKNLTIEKEGEVKLWRVVGNGGIPIDEVTFQYETDATLHMHENYPKREDLKVEQGTYQFMAGNFTIDAPVKMFVMSDE